MINAVKAVMTYEKSLKFPWSERQLLRGEALRAIEAAVTTLHPHQIGEQLTHDRFSHGNATFTVEERALSIKRIAKGYSVRWRTSGKFVKGVGKHRQGKANMYSKVEIFEEGALN